MVLTITNNDTIQKRHAYKENKDKLSILQRQIEKMTNRRTDKQTKKMLSLWDRAKAEDSRRVNAITTEKQRIEVRLVKRPILA